MNSPISPKNNKKVRALALGGSALALVLTGGFIGGSIDMVRPTPAYADAVIDPFDGPGALLFAIESTLDE